MAYDILATSKTPALIVYLIDTSASMLQFLGEKRRINAVTDALTSALTQMVFRSTKGVKVAPRYRIAMYAYNHHVYDLLAGVKTVDEIAKMGIPELAPMWTSETAKAFTYVEKLLERELPSMQDCPAPLVCHMTDGEYTGPDPEPIIHRIMKMGTHDGNVLVENVFISENILESPVVNHHEWGGILNTTKLTTEFANKLRNMSSTLPESYRTMMLESGYKIAKNAIMLLPGMNAELVEMGFVMSSATPIGHK